MVSFSNYRTQSSQHFPKKSSFEWLWGRDIRKIFVDVPDNSNICFFEEGKVLFLIPC